MTAVAPSPDAPVGRLVWALGLTQIIGYGSLYYSFAILAPAMAESIGRSQGWVFGALSCCLLAGSLVAPTAGRWADRFGAGRVMRAGSLAAALSLAGCALAPNAATFVAGLLAMEISASFVLYSTAFVAVVQSGAPRPERSITHLTLIAGFASTLFWPLTAMLHEHLSWQAVYLVFAALNLAVCAPLHAWLIRRSAQRPTSEFSRSEGVRDTLAPQETQQAAPVFPLMLLGFALGGFVLAGILVHMVPLTTALGLGTSAVFVSSLFGPAQVASRLINMAFGERLSQAHLTIIAYGLLSASLCVLVLTTPWIPGAFLFVVLFGLGSGLISIVGGTLPLELFGRRGYGARVGWATAARQITSSFAPVALAVMMAETSVPTALSVLIAISAIGVVTFVAIARLRTRR